MSKQMTSLLCAYTSYNSSTLSLATGMSSLHSAAVCCGLRVNKIVVKGMTCVCWVIVSHDH